MVVILLTSASQSPAQGLHTPQMGQRPRHRPSLTLYRKSVWTSALTAISMER